MRVKINLAIFLLILSCFSLQAQLDDGSSNIQFGAGWTSLGIETTDRNANGFIVNGMFEHCIASPVGVGGSVHFIHASQEQDDNRMGTNSTVPIYVNGRYYFGKEKFRFFFMASAGFQFSWRKLEGGEGGNISDHDSGVTLAGGTGLVYSISPKVLINLNYSLYWMNNSYYSAGLANTFSVNIGYTFGP